MSFLQMLSDNNPKEKQDGHANEMEGGYLLDELKMLFSTRCNFSQLQEIPIVNSSVLNYGIDEVMIREKVHDQQFELVEKYIEKILLRFEPRLLDPKVAIKNKTVSDISLEISALYENSPINIELYWDTERGKFYFNE